MSKSNNNRDGQGRLLLVSMPFSEAYLPSIQLGTLYGYLKNKEIPVDVYHAYLKFADILGPEWYHIICNFMPDEIFYPYFLFPENFKRHRKEIEGYFKRIIMNFPVMQPISLQTVLDRLSSFNEGLLKKIDFSKYSLIGFSVTFDQLKASLYLAGKIKQRYPNIPIVFGGAYCTEDLGISLLKTFSEIDFIVSGEGEEILTTLFLNLDKGGFDKIKGLGWRDNGTVKLNGPSKTLSLDDLPIPEYEDYFKTLEECSSYMREYIKNHLVIPIEGSRGCWWNKCTFCSLNSQFICYREKSVDRIIEEVKDQVNRYQCNSIRFFDNIQRVKNFSKLMSGLKDLNMDLDIILEIRAGHLNKEDYRLMRDAGVNIVRIGIEAFGNRMLKKMNKGVTTIENIAALKYCQEFGILALYNIIINYPNEDLPDLQETAENLKFLRGFIPPMSIHSMLLTHGSPVYHNPKDFNIKEIKIPNHAIWRFPQTVWQTLTPLFYEYDCVNGMKDRTSSWIRIFSEWLKTGDERLVKPLLFYQETGKILIIRDLLSEKGFKTKLEGFERQLYLFCDTIRTKSDILKQFPDISPDILEKILEKWITNRWMFREGEKFLSLAVRMNPMISSVVHLPKLTQDFFKRWRLSSPNWKMYLKIGSMADINLSINVHKKPAWLRRLKKMVTFKIR
ncbi:MAG: RiPP maturation radical SAM C-methyltransferase [bacterium]